MDDPLVMTIDLGSSAAKAALWAPEGLVAIGRAPLTTRSPKPDQAEQDPAAWWTSAVAACKRLEAGGHGPAARRAHAVHYTDLSGELGRQLGGEGRDRAMGGLVAEAGNLRTALRFWVAEGDIRELNRLAGILLYLNEARGWYHDTVELATSLLTEVLDHFKGELQLEGVTDELTLAGPIRHRNRFGHLRQPRWAEDL